MNNSEKAREYATLLYNANPGLSAAIASCIFSFYEGEEHCFRGELTSLHNLVIEEAKELWDKDEAMAYEIANYIFELGDCFGN